MLRHADVTKRVPGGGGKTAFFNGCQRMGSWSHRAWNEISRMGEMRGGEGGATQDGLLRLMAGIE